MDVPETGRFSSLLSKIENDVMEYLVLRGGSMQDCIEDKFKSKTRAVGI